MGQPITVVEKATNRSDVVRFELNRSLTSMEPERYQAAEEATDDTPSAELARRLFATGAVEAVHIYSNVVTVDLVDNHDGHGLAEIIEDLYIHYHPGVKPSYPETATITTDSQT